MSGRVEQSAAALQRTAKALWWVAIIAGLSCLAARLVDNAKLRVQLEQSRQEHRRLAAETAVLQAEVRLKSDRAEEIGRGVAEQTKQRSQLVLTMDGVLARVRALREQRDHFDVTREEVRRHFRELDAEYDEASRQAVGIQPP